MPVYEYGCRTCGHQFEFLVLRNLPEAECPACRGQNLEQQISLCAVSSDTTRQQNLSGAHAKAAAVRHEKSQQGHADLHEHFEDHKRGRAKHG